MFQHILHFSKFLSLLIFLLLVNCNDTNLDCISENNEEEYYSLSSRPLRVLILYDISGSMLKSGPINFIVDYLNPIISYIEQNGGEIAFGIIDGISNPFIRYSNMLPTFTHHNSMQKKNIFHAHKEKSEMLRKKKKILRQYSLVKQNRENKKTDFLNKVSECTKRKKAQNTNLIAGLERATIYFNETSTLNKPQEVLVIISDGKDTTNNNNYKFNIKTTVLIYMINNQTSKGILTSRKDVNMFESAEQAILSIVDSLLMENCYEKANY